MNERHAAHVSSVPKVRLALFEQLAREYDMRRVVDDAFVSGAATLVRGDRWTELFAAETSIARRGVLLDDVSSSDARHVALLQMLERVGHGKGVGAILARAQSAGSLSLAAPSGDGGLSMSAPAEGGLEQVGEVTLGLHGPRAHE